MIPSKLLLPALLALAVCCASPAFASAITITGNNARVSLFSSAGNGSASFAGTNIPASQLLDVTRGDYYSRTLLEYMGSGDNLTLLNTFTQKRSGNPGDTAQANETSLLFTATSNTTFSLSGAYGAADVSTAGRLHMEVYFRDMTDSSTAFTSYQSSLNTLDENFDLGGTGGDHLNVLNGSLTGFLVAGHQYQLEYFLFSQAYPEADGGAAATGYLRLDIGGGAPSSVPESGPTLAMLGLTAFSLATFRRKIARA